MIMASEVDAILNGKMPPCQIPNCLEHHDLGGFHSDVQPSSRSAFKAWMAGLEDEPKPEHPPGQLDLLESAQ